MKNLTWFELSKVPDGARVVFAEPHDIFPECLVPAGTRGTILRNYLNEMHNQISILPDDQGLRDALKHWNGEIIIGTHLDSGADTHSEEVDARAAAWFMPSPLAVVE